MVYILIAVLMFGILIAVHEFGHFFTAKLLGVKVNEFSIGMGPELFSHQKGKLSTPCACCPSAVIALWRGRTAAPRTSGP